MKWLSSFSTGAERAVMMTVPPPCWKRAAIALPAPFVPPVTKTRLPMNSFASKELLYDEVFISGFVISVNVDPLEFHGRQCPGSAEVCRNARRSPDASTASAMLRPKPPALPVTNQARWVIFPLLGFVFIFFISWFDRLFVMSSSLLPSRRQRHHGF